ncbi:Gfo/Idh/MocA family oxidoreductase [Heyndrickxia faecalis]|jgi:predicted dehydrogenase|uniref:Oxidoreductase n=2 Tax=Parageobacillus TaxID=1906945 RepID=A0AAN0YRQ6_PARTM|nr:MULTISPECIES: Gfo/Idh/MocA family oxidoreductase [Parageobacillus]AEH49812.1 oxidoreductase domain protein [Parageobacillus thermoglucosidasius C56-YS93]ANZ32227.1 oxidoreductase [Parageobacillus thermoglucosidasius]APM82962.1 oxidoreductase [Parageobacillus thermoglucosidasius]KJX67366.1 oxidoreductase [Parageobacillus thermoglucosidasius]MBY6269872.1 oxidoreductase [Parageobacillus thermoglucosidasius]
MNVLIVGLGYAGTRFVQAFSNINKNIVGNEKINIAYVDRSLKRSDIKYFEEIDTAIKQFDPQIIVISVNDEFHMDVIKKLNGFKGFVICEKPLANTHDDLELLEAKLSDISGFCLNLIERYSDATIVLKKYVEEHDLRLIRANFYWGKNRINDHRPTCGVISEIIHPLDLIQWICAPNSDLELKSIQGTRSDFSISGPEVLDSVAVTAYLGRAVVTGYSSFVNIVRKREVDLVFASPQNKLIFATMVFDTPVWDIDHLRIWERTSSGEHVIMDMKTSIDDSNPGLKTVRKLVRLVNDVTGYVLNGTVPSQPFACLQTALRLQKLLNTIEHNATTIGPVQYVVGPKREIYSDENDWERLG